MWAREAVKKGASVPEPYKMKEILADKEETERRAKAGREWVQASHAVKRQNDAGC